MKIGIIVHSQTGNTFSVAQGIQERLIKSGHAVNIVKVIATKDDQMEAAKIEFQSAPDISTYDGVIFGAPVRAFSLSAVMIAYLSQISSLKGKRVICYLTQQLPYPWMGGKHAIGQMTRLCESKDVQIAGTGIINWSSKQRQNKIDSMIDDFDKMFK